MRLPGFEKRFQSVSKMTVFGDRLRFININWWGETPEEIEPEAARNAFVQALCFLGDPLPLDPGLLRIVARLSHARGTEDLGEQLENLLGGGVNVDPYGNVLIAGYGMQTINIVCNAISPLCPGTANRKTCDQGSAGNLTRQFHSSCCRSSLGDRHSRRTFRATDGVHL